MTVGITNWSLSASLVAAVFLGQACSDSKKRDSRIAEPVTQESPAVGTLESMIGVLKMGDRACTAFLSGATELTTAYHCVENEPGQFYDVKDLSFKLANGQALELEAITTLLPKKDMAKLKIKGQSPVHLSSGVKTQNVLTLAAFDVEAGKLDVQNDCVAEEDIGVAGVFAYKCDTKGHYSGAPIFEGEKVIGMHLGYKRKIDRRVALDFASLESEQTDVLEVDYVKEGCHSRAHVRGGLYGVGGHNRAHIRGCNPIDIILDAISVKREEGDDTYQVVTRDIEEIKENTELQVNLLNKAKTAYETFVPCMDKAKADKDKDAAENCLSAFQRQMNTIIGELKAYLDQANSLKLDSLQAEARKFVDETHAISKDLINVWDTYLKCSASAVSLATPAEKTHALKACNTTLKLEFERINIAIKSLDVDILDTF